MDNDKAALEAALAEYEALMKAAILPADPATFKAAWHRALAYVRQGMEPAAWKDTLRQNTAMSLHVGVLWQNPCETPVEPREGERSLP